MEIILIILFLIFTIFTSLILPWISRNQIFDLKEKIARLENKLEPQTTIESPWEQAQPESHQEIILDSTPKNSSNSQVEPSTNLQAEPLPIKKEKVSFEQQFGARLPIWIGGIALALAGFFMVKYSIEIGLLSQNFRVILGLIFGCGLLLVADLVRGKPNFSNGTRISQALSGAGIADLYICIFAATNLYNLIPVPVGFVGLAAVTALAVLLSLKYGAPIALLGLVGGFLTPIMVGSNNPSAPILFIYLYFVFAGLMFVIRKNSWWIMSVLAVLGSFAWVGYWLCSSHFISQDSIYLALFLIAVSITTVMASTQEYEKEVNNNLFETTSMLNYLTLGGAVLLIGAIVFRSNFGIMEWGLFFLLTLAAAVLAYFNQRLYGLVPWFAMVINAFMLLAWQTPDFNLLALIIALFGAFHVVSGYVLQSRSEKPLIWAGLSSAASIGYYLIGYYKLHNNELFVAITLFWGLLALAFALFGTYALQNIIKKIPVNHPQKQNLAAIYAATITAFISIGLTIELPREFLPVAIAAQLFSIAWINNKLDIKDLRHIAAILLGLFGFLLLPQILFLLRFIINSLLKINLSLSDNMIIADSPAFYLGLPALFFGIARYFFCKQKDDDLVLWLEMTSAALIATMLYYLTFNTLNSQILAASFIVRGVITNVLFIFAIACLWVGKKFSRSALTLSGIAISIIAISRVIYFDLLIYNPLWSAQMVGTLPILNGLLITYFIPILLTVLLISELKNSAKTAQIKYLYGFILLISFAFISLNVRQFFHGAYLNDGATTSAEIYSYSAAWILFSATLLFIGVIKKDKMIRIASLIMMILTVGKVFLYDASELEGLLRVISFLGLGLSLLGLGWLYEKFVSDKEQVQK